MRSTFNIGFVCRPSKAQKSGLAPVEMTIVINGARTYLSLPRNVCSKVNFPHFRFEKGTT
jgi:hypothetical protein